MEFSEQAQMFIFHFTREWPLFPGDVSRKLRQIYTCSAIPGSVPSDRDTDRRLHPYADWHDSSMPDVFPLPPNRYLQNQ